MYRFNKMGRLAALSKAPAWLTEYDSETRKLYFNKDLTYHRVG